MNINCRFLNKNKYYLHVPLYRIFDLKHFTFQNKISDYIFFKKLNLCRGDCTPSVLGLCLAMNANSFAQNTTISGQIKTADGDPLVGAAVLVKGTSNGTVTDANGSFLFNNVAKGSFG